MPFSTRKPSSFSTTNISLKSHSTTLTAAAIQQQLSQDLGLSKRRIFSKKVEKRAHGTEHSDDFGRQIRKFFRLGVRSPLFRGLVEKLCAVLESEIQGGGEKLLSKNLSEILKSRHGGGGEGEKSLEELVRLAEDRGNTLECAICLGRFTPLAKGFTVVSCCAQVFHRNCLTSLLRLSRLPLNDSRSTYSRQRLLLEASTSESTSNACPVCRQSFTAKQIQPSLPFRKQMFTTAARRIQSYWRGYITRITNPMGIANLLTSRQRLAHITKRQNRSQQRLFTEIDAQVQHQKELLAQFEQLHIDWHEIREKSISKGLHEECAICMEPNQNASNTVLLSCTHVYHESCLGSWVIFKDNQEHCPLCRQSYFKTKFTL